ncbi:MAG: hypothetical protein J5829_07110 [Lachnospiraceae bacterium]|nr:hypothetical protein [Lachnospiraceae bacterium]
MTELTEERLDTVFGGAEERIVDGFGGGKIHAGDCVRWAGHKDWGEGTVMFVIMKHAWVSFVINCDLEDRLIKESDLIKVD